MSPSWCDHKWYVKNDFVYVLQFFSLISDSLGSVIGILFHPQNIFTITYLKGYHIVFKNTLDVSIKLIVLENAAQEYL